MRQEYAGFGLLCSALAHDKSNPDRQLVQTKLMYILSHLCAETVSRVYPESMMRLRSPPP
jgi:hypothetical protein